MQHTTGLRLNAGGVLFVPCVTATGQISAMIIAVLAICLLMLPLFWVLPRMLLASLMLSLLTLPLMFLLLPVFVLPPAAFACGYIAFQRAVLRAPQPAGAVKRVLYALPMVLAVAVFAFALFLFSTEYHA